MQRRILDQSLHCFPKCIWVIGRNLDDRIPPHLRQRGPVGHDDRHPACHGLQRRQAEAFIQRRVGEQTRSGIKKGQVRRRHLAGQHHFAGGAQTLEFV